MELELKRLPKYTPDYVVDEIKYYLTEKEKGKANDSILENAISLVNLAKVNNRINEEQAKKIKNIIRKIK